MLALTVNFPPLDRSDLRARDRERGVRQPVPERELRRVRHVQVPRRVLVVRIVRPARRELVVGHRNLADVLGERHRELPARIDLPEEGVRDSVASGGSRVPRLEQRRHPTGVCRRIPTQLRDRQRPPVHQHDHVWPSGGLDRIDQRLLLPRQADVAPRRGLAGIARRLTDHDDRHGRGLRGRLHRRRCRARCRGRRQ